MRKLIPFLLLGLLSFGAAAQTGPLVAGTISRANSGDTYPIVLGNNLGGGIKSVSTYSALAALININQYDLATTQDTGIIYQCQTVTGSSPVTCSSWIPVPASATPNVAPQIASIAALRALTSAFTGTTVTVGGTQGGLFNLNSGDTSGAVFTATASGTTLTVSSVAHGTIGPNYPQALANGGVAANTWITAQTGGTTGGAGTYTISVSQTISSPAVMTADNGGTDFVDPVFHHWKRKYERLLTVDFGITTGSDMTYAVQSAINVANAEDHILYVDGLYLITPSILVIPETGISFEAVDFQKDGFYDTTTTHQVPFFFCNSCANVSSVGMLYSGPNSYQTVFLLLGAAHITTRNNLTTNVALLETGSNQQTAFLVGGFDVAGVYAATTDLDLSSDITSSGDVMIGDGINLTESDPRRPAILLAYFNGATITGDQSYGYIHGYMYWGGDAGGTEGPVTNERKAKNLTVSASIAGNVQAGADFWGSMGSQIIVSGFTGGDSGDVGFDSEGCNGCHYDNVSILNNHSGAFGYGYSNINVTCDNCHGYTTVNGVDLITIFSSGDLTNQQLAFTNGTLTAASGIVGVVSNDNGGEFNGFRFDGNKLRNMRIDINVAHANLEINRNTLEYDWNLTTAIGMISFSNFTNNGVNSYERVQDNVTSSLVPQTQNNSGIFASLGSSFGTNNYVVDVDRNDLSAAQTGWSISATDTAANAAGLRMRLIDNKVSALGSPTIALQSAGYATVYRQGNYFDDAQSDPYPYGIPGDGQKWFIGEYTRYPTPVNGGYFGYVNVSTGEPGTWKTYGAISP